MSVEDKILALEALWDSLCGEPEAVESPAWHGEILVERVAALKRGEVAVELEASDVVKRKIRLQGQRPVSPQPLGVRALQLRQHPG